MKGAHSHDFQADGGSAFQTAYQLRQFLADRQRPENILKQLRLQYRAYYLYLLNFQEDPPVQAAFVLLFLFFRLYLHLYRVQLSKGNYGCSEIYRIVYFALYRQIGQNRSADTVSF